MREDTMVTMEEPTAKMLLNITHFLTTDTPGAVPPYWEGAVMIVLSVLLAIIMMASLVGNCMVIFVVFYFKGMHTKTNMFIVNLAVADFGVAALCMPFSLLTVINGDWVFGEILCYINAFFITLFLIASIHGLMYISIHKYFSIVKPLARLITQQRAGLMIVASWTVAFVAAFGPVVGWTVYEYKDATAQCGPKFPENNKEKSHAYFILTVGYAIPFIVLFYNYTVIFRAISRYSSRLKRHSNYDASRILKQQKQITTTLFIVFIAFFLCWTPFFVFAGMGTMIGFDKLPIWPNVLVYWCGYASSALNPIIYAFRTKAYRKAFVRLCCCFIGGNLTSDSSPSALRRLNASTYSENYQVRSPSCNSASLTVIKNPSFLSPSSINPPDTLLSANKNGIVINPLSDQATSTDIKNGKEINLNCNHGDGNYTDDVFDDEVEQRKSAAGAKKKRSVSESDKEGLEERHYGTIRKHSDLSPCLSVPLEIKEGTKV